MPLDRTTLSEFLAQQTIQLYGQPPSQPLASLLMAIADTVKAIAGMTVQGALGGMVAKLQSQNVQGETQMQLDVLSNQAFISSFEAGGLVAGLVSEEIDEFCPVKQGAPFIVIFDPLDGSSNIAVNVSVGSIFSVLQAPQDGSAMQPQHYLQAGTSQIAAGYAIYGPSTMLVLTVGTGTHGFTLDPDSQDFILTHPAMQIAPEASEFAINTSNERFWEPPIRRYISECKAGKTGARGKDFNMRWIASMVADVHRILVRGGVYMYPKDSKDPSKAGRLRLMYEASPMSFIVEQAGGASSTGHKRIMELVPEHIHQRVPVIMGSRCEIERICRYHAEFDSGAGAQPDYLPLFNERSLFR